MHCAEFRRHLEALIDGTLDGSIRRDLAEHMLACHACARLAEDDGFWSGAVRRALEHRAPADLRDAILADGLGTAPAGTRRRTWGAIARHVWRELTWKTWAEAAAVAGVVVVAVTLYTGRDHAPRAFDLPGPVTVIASPSAADDSTGEGSLYLTVRLF
jgi:hypothetical protein